MSVGIILIGLFIFVFTVFALYDIVLKDAKCETFQSACISCCCGLGVLLIISGVIWYCSGQTDTEPLYNHIDHSKTRTIKENGEVTDLYLTIDGKEYHFELGDAKE
jgi:hypothetical protein